MRTIAIISVLTTTLVVAACGDASDHGADESAHWSYAHQSEWQGLSDEFGACGSGQMQSPINLLTPGQMSNHPDLAANFEAGAGTFLNNGHTLQFTPSSDNSTLNLGEDTYGLLQFHFHAPSEHTVEGQSFPLELHFVTQNEAGELAVLGILFEEGEENPTLASLLEMEPAGTGASHVTSLQVSPVDLLPAGPSYFAYGGSLTTPPCSEGVRWNVMAAPLSASAAQIAAFEATLGPSARQVQALNDRDISLGK